MYIHVITHQIKTIVVHKNQNLQTPIGVSLQQLTEYSIIDLQTNCR